ncbi:hypothetical protein ATY30_26895 [Sinorhizobium americanum]|uniref:Uncharacterized protein n=1 Tax=Sinorhizobium americanum TaxID=194963 RepID=A0A2S3YT63_9HYPH|nr:hypothetical protein CO656_24615 [Sinorhizobium sp. FG01]PDT51156.1 hypothetical protein CO664_22520 [Sinorhizobium sp. NG07B]POH25810.1 hypothetical protein ATY30_26895 [Sinorhizobium americanum]POH34821.1 hypothetical protein ATY31_05445 [Sinorhizobium americanum]
MTMMAVRKSGYDADLCKPAERSEKASQAMLSATAVKANIYSVKFEMERSFHILCAPPLKHPRLILEARCRRPGSKRSRAEGHGAEFEWGCGHLALPLSPNLRKQPPEQVRWSYI